MTAVTIAKIIVALLIAVGLVPGLFAVILKTNRTPILSLPMRLKIELRTRSMNRILKKKKSRLKSKYDEMYLKIIQPAT
jgi:hypothetical protein